MKNIKRILLILVVALLVVVPRVYAEEDEGEMVLTTGADDKVKVYIFEAGGCPYCEMEMEYLTSLESYNQKFVIVKKELYVDHVEWQPGKDYELGKKVAEEFKKAGFEYASYTGTPFVVISNLYAAAVYSDDLEGYINTAYDEGDKDIVGCFERGESCSIIEEKKDNSDLVATIILIAIVGGIVAFTLVSRHSMKEEVSEKEKEEPKKVEEVKKEIIKEEIKEEKVSSKTSKKSKKRK